MAEWSRVFSIERGGSAGAAAGAVAVVRVAVVDRGRSGCGPGGVAVAVCLAGSGPEAVQSSAIGVKLTSFHVEPLTGGSHPITESDLMGKVTLINFWGPWCSTSVVEFPHLVELEKHLRQEPDFQFLSISSNSNPRDEKGFRESTEHFLKQRQADFPTYRDPDAAATIALIKAAGLERFGYPTTLLLDRPGDDSQDLVGLCAGRRAHRCGKRLRKRSRDNGRSTLENRPIFRGGRPPTVGCKLMQPQRVVFCHCTQRSALHSFYRLGTAFKLSAGRYPVRFLHCSELKRLPSP